jgi:hypothetical protein
VFSKKKNRKVFRLNSEIIFQNITKQKHKKGASKLASMGGSHNPFIIGEGRGPPTP